MKKLVILIGCIWLSTASANYVDSDGILRDSRGVARAGRYSDATVSCPSGTHIPSVREYARWSQRRGARGVVEIKRDEGRPPEGYKRIQTAKDSFYFSSEGFRGAGGVGLDSTFWSSSVVQSDHLDDNGDIYYLDGLSGTINRCRPEGIMGFKLGILCFRN